MDIHTYNISFLSFFPPSNPSQVHTLDPERPRKIITEDELSRMVGMDGTIDRWRVVGGG